MQIFPPVLQTMNPLTLSDAKNHDPAMSWKGSITKMRALLSKSRRRAFHGRVDRLTSLLSIQEKKKPRQAAVARNWLDVHLVLFAMSEGVVF